MHSSPKRDALIRSLFESMNTMKRSMQGHLQTANDSVPIPRSQLELLMTVRQLQPVSFKELARQLYLTPGAVSQLAEGLEQHGLIERQTDAADRRIQCLHTSEKGDSLLQDVEKRRRRIMETVMHNLSDEELEIWQRVQQKLIRQFQSEITPEERK